MEVETSPSYKNGTSAAVEEVTSLQSSQVSNSSYSNPNLIAVRTGTDIDFNSVSRLIAQRFPETPGFLVERLIVSIEQRQARLLSWRQEDVRTLTEYEAAHAHEALNHSRASNNLKESSECDENEEAFSKPPEMESSHSHFVCPICSLSTPSEEGKGDSWM